jgi:hypothetical protein
MRFMDRGGSVREQERVVIVASWGCYVGSYLVRTASIQFNCFVCDYILPLAIRVALSFVSVH